jgi:translation initiation factor IF-2
MELKADPDCNGRGTVIEARMVDGRGPVANVLVQEGTINIGDFIVIGRAFGKVRDIKDDRGKSLEQAGPSTPIEVAGLSAVPDAGDRCYIVDSLKKAEQVATQRVTAEREQGLAAPKVTLDNIFTQIAGSDRKQLNLVVKADVQGSVETLKASLENLTTSELTIRVLHAGVGGISESDVLLAEASGAIILGFHVIASARARELADQKNAEIRTYQVIYELLEDVRKAAAGLLDPELREEVLGHAVVRDVFKISKVGMIAGCYVTDGSIERNAKIRVTRNDIVIENNRTLEQLKRFKDDAKEVKSGQECGMKIDGYDDIKVGDILECYRVTSIQRTF